MTSYSKGHGFEEQIARRLKKEFEKEGLSPHIKTRQLANGLNVKRPYEIDVHIHLKGKGLFGKDADVWVECKWKEKSSVKRADVAKLTSSAQDVYWAAKAGREELYYNGLILVSNQRFDIDALNYANQEGVLCVLFDGKKWEEQNEPKWLGEPVWLKQVM